MKKMRLLVAIMMITTMFCFGCAKEDTSSSDQTSGQESGQHDHDHEHGEGEHEHTH